MRKSWFFVFLHMVKKWSFLFCVFIVCIGKSQEVRVPVDLRQHNLTDYNTSLFNPVMSFYGNSPQSVSIWTRWQWQQIDADPTTLFLNYTRQLNEESSAGIGFFQHNTGVFVNTGALLNYAYIYNINDDLKIGIGLNLFGFKQVLADSRFIIDPDIILPQASSTDDFILQAAPGILFKWKDLQLGLTSENLFDYNFERKERHSSPKERIYLISGGYDFHLFSGKSVLRPIVYYKSVPFQDKQIGLNTLFTTDRYWAQAGYNSFYGASVGVGGKFFRRISIGALMEFATDPSLDGKNSTFEIVAAYQLGKVEVKEKKKPKKKEELIVKKQEEDSNKEDTLVAKEENEKENMVAERKLQKAQEKQEKDAMNAAKKEEKLALIAKEAAAKKKALALKKEEEEADLARQQQIANAKNQELMRKQEVAQQKMDSLANLNAERIRRKEAALAAQQRLDSINNTLVKKETVAVPDVKEEVVLEQNEKYEEVKTEDGLKAGFYLIANVFGTEKYYNSFMENLNKKGLNPKSFLRSLNNYQYVYLARYDTMEEARKARKSNFFGKYPDKTWVFRVVGE